MDKSYYLIAWRNLMKNKDFSTINIGGLSVGMAFALITGLWIQNELSYDSFHSHGDRLALVQKHTLFNDEKNTMQSTPYPLHEELKTNYPEVKRASKVSWELEQTLK